MILSHAQLLSSSGSWSSSPSVDVRYGRWHSEIRCSEYAAICQGSWRVGWPCHLWMSHSLCPVTGKALSMSIILCEILRYSDHHLVLMLSCGRILNIMQNNVSAVSRDLPRSVVSLVLAPPCTCMILFIWGSCRWRFHQMSPLTHSARKLYLYSCHDTTLVPVLISLGCYDNKWPNYAADICVEVYQDDNKQHWVKVLYEGEVCANWVVPHSVHSPSVKFSSLFIIPFDLNRSRFWMDAPKAWSLWSTSRILWGPSRSVKMITLTSAVISRLPNSILPSGVSWVLWLSKEPVCLLPIGFDVISRGCPNHSYWGVWGVRGSTQHMMCGVTWFFRVILVSGDPNLFTGIRFMSGFVCYLITWDQEKLQIQPIIQWNL